MRDSTLTKQEVAAKDCASTITTTTMAVKDRANMITTETMAAKDHTNTNMTATVPMNNLANIMTTDSNTHTEATVREIEMNHPGNIKEYKEIHSLNNNLPAVQMGPKPSLQQLLQ